MNASTAHFARADVPHPQAFPVLTDTQIARVEAAGTVQTFADGDVVVEVGQPDAPFHVVLSGELEVVSVRGRQELLITVHGAGEFTGELTLLTQGRGLVRSRARGETVLVRVEAATLRALLQTDAELGEVLVRAFILRRVGLLAEGYGDAVLVGSRHSAETQRLRTFLSRNGQPYHYVDVESDHDVQVLLDDMGVAVNDIPILICQGKRVLRNPTELELAECLGLAATDSAEGVHDIVICGAGPSGLAAAIYGASEGLDVFVVEGTAPGGQAASSSNIENYLGFPTGVSGQDLAARATTQAEKFGARISIARHVEGLSREEAPLRLTLTGGTRVRARAIIIATGAEYGTLDVPEVARFQGAGIYYAATAIESQYCGEDEVVIVGGGNSAGQAASFLARTSRHVHVLVRGPSLAASMSRYLIRRIGGTPNITVHTGCQVVALRGHERLECVSWRHGPSGITTTRELRHVFMMTGARPRTDWLRGCVAMDANGFVLTGQDLSAGDLADAHWPLQRAPYLFETSRPNVFAVGDVRANNVKRVASAVGEGSVCIQLVHRALAQ